MPTIDHKKFTFRHMCDLPRETRDELTPSPYTSFVTKFFFRLRRFTTVYQNYASERYFRSSASLTRERQRHLSNERYLFVIHPFSTFVMKKKAVMCFLWLITFLIDPFLSSFLPDSYLETTTTAAAAAIGTSITIQALLFCDMVSRFFVGYTVHQTREIVLDPGRIAKHYLYGYFPIDLLPIVPTMVWTVEPSLPHRIEFALFQLHMVRTLRVRTMIDNFDVTMKNFSWGKTFRVCVILTMLCLLIIHWWTCLLGAIPTVRAVFRIDNNDSWTYKLRQERQRVEIAQSNLGSEYTIVQDYLQHAAMVMCHFFGAGTGRHKTNDAIEMTILSLILLSGLAFYIYTVAKIIQLFGVVNVAESKYEELVIQTGEYMFSKNFPSRIRKRIHKYYDYKFDKTFFSEANILDSLSEHLRMEVLLYSCRTLVERVQIFKGLSKAAVGSILALLRQEVYLPKDVIMTAQDESGTLYFVLNGTCAVKLLSGKEAMHIEDGQHFGDVKEFTTSKHILYTVVALEASEIYSLTESDIKFCCKNHPEISHKLEAMTRNKAKFYNSVLALAQLEDEVKATDIIDELRRGNILHHGRKRETMVL